MCLWFYALGGLPLATAMTLNYMSSVWMALFLIGGSIMFGGAEGRGPAGGRRAAGLCRRGAGAATVARPQQFWHALAGLLSGVLAALAYLQITALGRAGEPEDRTVFYFNLGGIVIGGALMAWQGLGTHTLRGVALLLAIGVLAVVAQVLMTRAYTVGSMYKRILVPTDGSDITSKAVSTALDWPSPLAGRTRVIGVKEPFPYSAISEMQPVPPQEFYDAQERIAAERVKAVAAAAQPPAWTAAAPPSKRCTPGKPSSTWPSSRVAT
jgi:hypothetical protein